MFMAILVAGVATAQNANRHGFFLELGVGGIVGSTPRTGVSIVGNTVYSKCLSGAAADFGFGGRFRIKNHWAYEVKAEAQIPVNNPRYSLVGRIMPVGFRYTSSELWRNYSCYAHFNLGGALCVTRGNVTYNLRDNNAFVGNYFIDAPYEINIRNEGGEEGWGISYSVGTGINLTTHLYLEANYSSQVMFNSYRKHGHEILNYGIVAGVVGYRF